MWLLPQDVCTPPRFEASYSHSHWGDTAPVPLLWSGVWPCRRSATPLLYQQRVCPSSLQRSFESSPSEETNSNNWIRCQVINFSFYTFLFCISFICILSLLIPYLRSREDSKPPCILDIGPFSLFYTHFPSFYVYLYLVINMGTDPLSLFLSYSCS